MMRTLFGATIRRIVNLGGGVYWSPPTLRNYQTYMYMTIPAHVCLIWEQAQSMPQSLSTNPNSYDVDT